MNGFSWVVCNINCSLLCKAFPQLKSSIFFFCFSLRFTFLFLNDGVAIRFSSLCLFLLVRLI